MSLFTELKRRNVVRVGIAYCVIGWIIAQLAEFAFENFGAPDWVLKTVVVLLLLGLPLALFLAWAYELTPEGLKREQDVDRTKSITHLTGRKLDFVIIAALVVALGYFIWERQAGVEGPEQPAAQVAGATVPAGPGPRSIAVLPFVNMSSDEEQEWFADGLTEEILNALARTPDLLVTARTSSFKFKNSTEDIPTIAKSLGVAHILEGSVRPGRERLRVTAQLVRANDGFHLWSETYDRNPEDVIAIQEEVAIEIATALETAIDPEALAKMVSAGTSSVPAYNAYLEGLAQGANSLSTGDAYEFLAAREAFERAVALDPTFAVAYWELAKFWEIQLRGTNLVAGMVELPREEMLARFNAAIDAAIEQEQDPVNVLQYRVLRDIMHLRINQALRLNTEYLDHRPNDPRAQQRQLNFFADMSMDDELKAAIADYQERNGYDVALASDSMTFSLISDDREFIRKIANGALERVGDSPFTMYQAHRALLWAGDIDGASRLVPILQSSELPEDARRMVTLRQACAENRKPDAMRIYDGIRESYPDERSMIWIGQSIMGNQDAAIDTLIDLDESGELGFLSDFLSYAYFDARPFPNLMKLLQAQGVTPREPLQIPYRCKA